MVSKLSLFIPLKGYRMSPSSIFVSSLAPPEWEQRKSGDSCVFVFVSTGSSAVAVMKSASRIFTSSPIRPLFLTNGREKSKNEQGVPREFYPVLVTAMQVLLYFN